jgi:hypothetical protein
MNEVLMSGFGVSYKGVGLSVNTTHDGTTITFTSGDIIKDILTDPRITNNGKSVGERNIEWLHEKLDGWIRQNLEKSE